jgi:hypothetical protein
VAIRKSLCAVVLFVNLNKVSLILDEIFTSDD